MLKPLKGSEKVSVHAYAYTRGSDFCSRTIALKFSSELPYTQTLVAMRNRALVTGANALSITGWEEKNGITTFTGHFFDCHSKKGFSKLLERSKQFYAVSTAVPVTETIT